MKLANLITIVFVVSFCSLANAKPQRVLFCSSTNGGFGGDEGIEISILSNQNNNYRAVLTQIDPSGAHAYATLPVQPTQNRGLPSFVGNNFALTLLTNIPKTSDGFIHAKIKAFDSFGFAVKQNTFCRE